MESFPVNSQENFPTINFCTKHITTTRSGAFSVQCDSRGYIQGTIEFQVTGRYGGNGEGISKKEFDRIQQLDIIRNNVLSLEYGCSPLRFDVTKITAF